MGFQPVSDVNRFTSARPLPGPAFPALSIKLKAEPWAMLPMALLSYAIISFD
jgi:hypothetical protein